MKRRRFSQQAAGISLALWGMDAGAGIQRRPNILLIMPGRIAIWSGRYPHETGIQTNQKATIDPVEFTTPGNLLGLSLKGIGNGRLTITIPSP